ncbi:MULTISPECIES: type III-B CRISPR module RAMP protein Cmr1 [Thermotoga]|uniref:type III-B CRISPR module RAMP protein Cmr1 n=1 Tax=Thermotoga TaxID=2335 RepID=UPI001D12FC1A|nr:MULTISPECIES: type III-B CRISPR module RAMP protein Cmr1 [Thermotoga]
MSVLEIECKVVTPMFSRGAAEPKWENGNRVYPFELRPQSIKGVLRFWFRAIAPTVIDIYSLEGLENLSKKEKERWEKEKYKGLKYLEGLIFGSQERKSSFSLEVKVEGESQALGKYMNNRFSFTDDRLKDTKYALYGLYDKSGIYEYLQEGKNFIIILQTANDSIKGIILSLLKLVSTFSGFGAKTRKGFGEFEIVDPKLTRNDYNLVISECQEHIREFVNHHNSSSKVKIKLGRTNFNGIPDFPCFCDYKIFEITKFSGNSPLEVLREVFKVGRNFKGWYPSLKQKMRFSEGDCVKDLVEALEGLLKGRKTEKKIEIPTAVVGLPIQYQNLGRGEIRRLKVIVSSSLRGLGIDDIDGRKASPLFLSVHEGERGKWKLVVLLMRSRVTNDGELITEVKGGKTPSSGIKTIVKEEKDYKNLLEWIKKLGGKEIQGG